jgi:hypothetical protein
MHGQTRRTCPAWCVADHDADDEGGRLRHRSETTVVAGIALDSAPPHEAHAVELLIEMHGLDGDPLVAVYIGDGVDGIDLAVETAERLVRRVTEVLSARRSDAI